MILRTDHIIGKGAYADFFREHGNNIAYKLFVSGAHPTNTWQGLNRPGDEERRKNTFKSQCKAYEIASEHPYLRDHIPHFHGVIVVEDVQERNGSSVAHQYMLDHCYAIDFIAGEETKSGGVLNSYDHLRMADQAFRQAGICYLSDVSVFSAEDPRNFKVIDFAIEEFEPFW